MHAWAVFAVLTCGLADRGVFPDLDDKVALRAPRADAARTWVRVDAKHGVVTLYEGDDPLKAYAAKSKAPAATVAQLRELLRPADWAELAPLVRPDARIVSAAPRDDRDGDGIVDRLDLLIGAKRLLHNGARYIDRYVPMPYPNGDVPRSEGVCSDTVIRAMRNAGVDLQRAVHEDILAARAAYPMVEKVDASINHRRVRTMLPWFQRHWQTVPLTQAIRPGDVVFFDTFPSRAGPDHLGVASDGSGEESGKLLIINNWTDGATDAEMDFLSFVPVTHVFRSR